MTMPPSSSFMVFAILSIVTLISDKKGQKFTIMMIRNAYFSQSSLHVLIKVFEFFHFEI